MATDVHMTLNKQYIKDANNTPHYQFIVSKALFSLLVFFICAIVLFPRCVFTPASVPTLYPAVDYFWSAWIISVGS